MDAWNRGQGIELSAFPDYWGDKPQIKKVSIRFDEEVAVRVAALEAKEIQMALNMSPELAKDTFKREDTPVSEIAIIRLNSQFGPFKDKKVREAANYAIDRKALIEKIYGGAAGPVGNQEIAEYVTGYSKSLEAHPYDLDKAKALLKEAGAVGAKVDLWGTRGHWTNDSQLSEAVTGMLNEAGFKADLKQPPFADWVTKVFVAEKNDEEAPDMMIYNHSNELFDASLTIGQNLTCKGTSSTTCIPEVDKLADEALKETDEAKRQELYDQAWQTLADDAAYVSIAEVKRVTFLDEGLKWTPESDGFVRFQNMEFTT
jgi:peptide/nickel transport system substrate-binding protein